MQTLHDEIETHREPMRCVDLTGTYLKYLGSRADICELGQGLMAVRLHWKRLLQRAAQVKQQLRQAFNETKRVNIDTLMQMVAWHSGRTSVSGRRTFPVLRLTFFYLLLMQIDIHQQPTRAHRCAVKLLT